MKYNGIELKEMTLKKWDGKLRWMLAWNCVNDTPVKTRIVEWYKNEHGHIIWRDDVCKYWNNCADIPEEEPKYDFVETILKTTQEQNGCITIPKRAVEQMRELEKACGIVYEENKELKAKNESLRIEREEMAKNISADLLFELIERSINAKPYDGNIVSDGELHKIAEFVQNKILDYKSENNQPKEEKSNLKVGKWYYCYANLTVPNAVHSCCVPTAIDGNFVFDGKFFVVPNASLIVKDNFVTYDLSKTIKYEPSIFDRIEELPTNKVRKMTNKELAEWLAKGNGQFKNGNFGSFRTELVYCKNEENVIVDNDCLIRAWNEDTWHEPMIEE